MSFFTPRIQHTGSGQCPCWVWNGRRPHQKGRGGVGNWPIQDILCLVCVCKNQSSLYDPRPVALPTLLQYYYATFAQYMTPPPTFTLYAIYHTILVMTISCKGKVGDQWVKPWEDAGGVGSSSATGGLEHYNTGGVRADLDL